MNELPVPSHYQQAAEEVRAHLCHLRGGAPFLSPQDAFTLVTWLDQGVRTGDVLLALERAAEARRKARSRFPLTLGSAKRHLGKAVPAPVRPPASGEAAFGPILDGVEGGDALRAALDAVPVDHPDADAHAVAAIRVFLDDRWAALPPPERRALEDRARAELGDLLALVDEDTARALVDETARDLFRQRWPRLTAAAVRSVRAARG